MGTSRLNLGEIGNTMLDNVVGRIGLNLNRMTAPPKTYTINQKNSVLIELFKGKQKSGIKGQDEVSCSFTRLASSRYKKEKLIKLLFANGRSIKVLFDSKYFKLTVVN